uniref:Uncharacterized protein n=1 Tax=Gouania willdenowi TaxID=441366 RepID=A0A8C5GNL4_GOUWI
QVNTDPAFTDRVTGHSFISSPEMIEVYLPFLNFPAAAPVFCFFFADPLTSGSWKRRKTDSDPVTEKKESSRPCVLPCRLFIIFLHPLRILSSYLNCFSAHINWISPSSSGSLHFKSTEVQSTTSGSKNNFRASLYSQSSGGGLTLVSMFSRISSMLPCCLIRSMALLGPMPLMVPQ